MNIEDRIARHRQERSRTGARVTDSELLLGQAELELRWLRGLINTPHTADFLEAVPLEAAHQIERWGAPHDAGKEPPDWFWLLGFLAGKAVSKPEKRLHHIISSAAVLLNWYRHETGDATAFRPGIAPPDTKGRP